MSYKGTAASFGRSDQEIAERGTGRSTTVEGSGIVQHAWVVGVELLVRHEPGSCFCCIRRSGSTHFSAQETVVGRANCAAAASHPRIHVLL